MMMHCTVLEMIRGLIEQIRVTKARQGKYIFINTWERARKL